MSFLKEFKLLLKARYSLLYISTKEEERLEYAIRSCIQLYSNRSLYMWDFVDGYTGNPSDSGFASRNPLQALELIEKLTSENPAVFLLKDFHLFLNDVSVARKLKNLIKILRNQAKTIIIIADDVTIPQSLSELITVVTFDLPQPLEIRKELLRVQDSLGYSIPQLSLDNLVQSCQGLSLERIRRVLSKIIATYKEINIESLDLIFTEKKQIISQTQILEFHPTNQKISDIGGLENLKEWLNRRSGGLSKRAESYGLPSPKGLLLVGVQGTGKSLTAKAIASDWNLPLLRLDVGKLFGGIVGESESRMRQMIQLSEAIAPCILWIDEVDKAFSGIESKGDSGTTNRVLATFITWLSEKKSILKVHLSRLRPKSWAKYDIEILSKVATKFSGAEIEEAIIEAMHIAFSENREFTTEDIYYSIKQFVPLAYSNSEQIEALEDWATSGKVRLASK